MKLEICVFSINDVLSAIKGGADRLELCASYLEGGITPSHATITETFKYFDSENVVLMIRPRGGNFIYSDAEFEVMKKDILHCKELGVKNVIFGIINKDATLDVTRNKELVELASPMHCTYNALLILPLTLLMH
jgi:copper homeostasis protein